MVHELIGIRNNRVSLQHVEGISPELKVRDATDLLFQRNLVYCSFVGLIKSSDCNLTLLLFSCLFVVVYLRNICLVIC